jgi:hypothetical protein
MKGRSRTYEGEVLGGRKARQRQGVEVPKEGWLLLAGPSRPLSGRMGKLGAATWKDVAVSMPGCCLTFPFPNARQSNFEGWSLPCMTK